MIRSFLSLFGPRCDFGSAGWDPCRRRARWRNTSSRFAFGWCDEHRGPADEPIERAKPCPLCGAEPTRVLYLGAPMLMCECSCVFGLWSFLLRFQVNDGGWAFVPYEAGGYWRALWAWITGRVS
jgi:hypothetical protein